MEVLVCPHCGNHRIVQSKVPKDVVVVLPCPSCHELVVLFRNRVIALSREIIENGSFEDRKNHIAGIIAEFLEAGIFPPQTEEQEGDSDSPEPRALEEMPRRRRKAAAPIRQSEVDHFVKCDLLRIDDSAYFKKHFG